ncbi:unnamed protein product [Symbiodinium pilosum]|uniref:Uncharacterized protein n=1 Tax=Symbiodinium pilosum TaxID=2952 RepID=A0A812X8X9_SYMPI|nr:unnamed protein product [Symbiodinium pilosum]
MKKTQKPTCLERRLLWGLLEVPDPEPDTHTNKQKLRDASAPLTKAEALSADEARVYLKNHSDMDVWMATLVPKGTKWGDMCDADSEDDEADRLVFIIIPVHFDKHEKAPIQEKLGPRAGVLKDVLIDSVSKKSTEVSFGESSTCKARAWGCWVRPNPAAARKGHCKLCLRAPCRHGSKCSRKNFNCTEFCHRGAANADGILGCYVNSCDAKRHSAALRRIMTSV